VTSLGNRLLLCNRGYITFIRIHYIGKDTFVRLLQHNLRQTEIS